MNYINIHILGHPNSSVIQLCKTSKMEKNILKRQKKNNSPKNKNSRKQSREKNDSFTSKLDNWLLKKGVISNILPNDGNSVSVNHISEENENIKTKCSNYSDVPKNKRKAEQQKVVSGRPLRQGNLESFIPTKHNKKNIVKTSSESCDLPTFRIKKSATKNNELYKKYGVVIPTIEEILQEQKELEHYKSQLSSFHIMNEPSLEVFSPAQYLEEKLDQCHQILDCKHLSLSEISVAVNSNLKYLKDIMDQKVFNKRHELFYDVDRKPLTLSTKDLTYNTSMILFTYDQTEYMLTKLKKYLDPDDKLTNYFFQVLLPELCLKIFMDCHKMCYKDAINYLDTRPIEN